MTKQHILSPPLSLGEDKQHRFHHMMQHTTSMSNGSDGHDKQSYTCSGQNINHGTPSSNQWMNDRYSSDLLYSPYQEQNAGLSVKSVSVSNDWWSSPTTRPSPYYASDAENHSQYLNQRYAIASPPTPGASDLSGGETGLTTHIGPSVVPNVENQRVAPLNKPRGTGSRNSKKSKAAKGDKPKIPKISAPLSVLTKDMHHTPIRDMEAWVNRPADVRSKEVEKRNGYVTRPMNSFMLYRSAYAERTKLWCLQNNHQVVSSVSGESWPIEPEEVREQYNEFARIERDNHQKAHPGYKFSPSKSTSSARKRKGLVEESDDQASSDDDDPDPDWRSPGGKKPKNKSSARRVGQERNHTYNQRNFDDRSYVPGYEQSSYEVINPGKPLPAAMNEFGPHGQYYQTTVYPSIGRPAVEDVRIRRTERSSAHTESAFVGLPGAQHYELLEHDSLGNSPMAIDDFEIDPTLLEYSPNYLEESHNFFTDQQFQEFNEEMLGSAAQPYGHGNESNPYYLDSSTWQYGESHVIENADDEIVS